MQLRRDLLHGRLLCPPTDAIFLAAHIIQGKVHYSDCFSANSGYLYIIIALRNRNVLVCVSAEAGDYDETMEGTDYVAEFVLLPNQTPKQNEKIQSMHKTLGYLYTSFE